MDDEQREGIEELAAVMLGYQTLEHFPDLINQRTPRNPLL